MQFRDHVITSGCRTEPLGPIPKVAMGEIISFIDCFVKPIGQG